MRRITDPRGRAKDAPKANRAPSSDQEDNDDLRSRVEALEAEVQENRALNRRIAELTDVVTELLIPLHDRDDAKVTKILAKYREQI